MPEMPRKVREDLRLLLSDFLDPRNTEELLRPDYGVSRPWLVDLGFDTVPSWAKRTSEPPRADVSHSDKHYYWFTREDLLNAMSELYGKDTIAEFLLGLEKT